MTKVEIKDTNYVYENVKRPVIITDENGEEFRIQLMPGGGLIVNKLDGTIAVKPRAVNEIHVF